MELAIRMGMPVIFENPRESRVWLTDEVDHLLKVYGGVRCQTDFCQYGTKLRKPTTFAFWNMAPPGVDADERLTCGGKDNVWTQRSYFLEIFPFALERAAMPE